MTAKQPHTGRQWVSNDGKLVFAFSWRDGGRQASEVTVRVYRRMHPKQGFSIDMGYPRLEKRFPFDYTAPDGYRIYGTLQYVFFDQMHSYAKVAIWGNFHHGRETSKRHFEGTMVTFESHSESQPAPDSSNQLEPEASDQSLVPIIEPPQPGRSAKGDYDLFPYVYLRSWPEIAAHARQLNFLEYRPGDGGPNAADQGGRTLFETLMAIKADCAPDARQRMEQTAIAFIEGDAPWQVLFVDLVQTGKTPLRELRRLYRILAENPDRRIDALLAEVAAIFEITPKKVVPFLESPEYQQMIERVWQSYFALVIVPGCWPRVLRELIRILITAHLLVEVLVSPAETPPAVVPESLLEASIILPRAVFPLPPNTLSPPVSIPGSPPLNRGTHGWIEPYAIGELQIVRHRLRRYERGDIATIVNVLKGERREVTRRSLTRRGETYRESTDEAETMIDHHLEAMADLRSEALKTIADTTVETGFNDFQTTYGPPANVTLSGSWQMAFKPNPELPARNDISHFARRVMNRTTSRISRDIRRTRSVAILNEDEQKVSSVLNNTSGRTNIRGIYRWVNAVYRVKVMNYGNRLMIKFMLPQPALRFIRGTAELEGENLLQPLTLSDFGIVSCHDVIPENYADVAAYYEVTDVEPPPAATRTVSALLQGEQDKLVSIPAGYRAVQAHVVSNGAPAESNLKSTGVVGRHGFICGSQGQQRLQFEMAGEDDTVPVGVSTALPPLSPPSFRNGPLVSVEIVCSRRTTRLAAWQIKTYEALLKGYQRCKAAYYQLAVPESNAPPKTGRSRAAYRRIEREQIKQGCLRLLLQRCYERIGASTGPAEATRPSGMAVNEPRYLQFFETVFEWPEMTYTFYTNFSDHPNFIDDIDFDGIGLAPRPAEHNLAPAAMTRIAGDDERFSAFLQAGLARVMVPVNPDDAARVLYFLSSGMVWEGAETFTPVDPTDIEIVYELKRTAVESREQAVEVSAWEEIVPTTMQILADNGEL